MRIRSARLKGLGCASPADRPRIVGPLCRPLWLNDGSTVRLPMLTSMDEYSRECLGIAAVRCLRIEDVLDGLTQLSALRRRPDYIRLDSAEFTAKIVREWLRGVGAKTLYIEPNSPWENGYLQSFNGNPRRGILDQEIFYALKEAQVLADQWRRQHDTIRPHSPLGYGPPGAGGDPPMAPTLHLSAVTALASNSHSQALGYCCLAQIVSGSATRRSCWLTTASKSLCPAAQTAAPS